MGLRLKFNLVLLLVFIAGFATVGVVVHRHLESGVREDAVRAAGIALDAAILTSIDPRVASALGSRVAELKMKEFAVVDAQPGLELEAITRLQANKTGAVRGEISEKGVATFFMARTHRASAEQGGGDKVRLVTVNLNASLMNAKNALYVFMSSLGAVFFAVFFGLNLMLDRMIVRPVAEMSKLADAISVGNFSIPEFAVKSSDEIGVLSTAFNRLRRSTEEAIKLLKG